VTTGVKDVLAEFVLYLSEYSFFKRVPDLSRAHLATINLE